MSVLAFGGNLRNLTSTTSTLTFSATYNGSAARPVGLNLANANTWTALQTFGAGLISQASSTFSSNLNVGGTGFKLGKGETRE